MTLLDEELAGDGPGLDCMLSEPEGDPAGATPPNNSRFVVYERPVYDPLLLRNDASRVYCIVCEIIRTPMGDALAPRSVCLVDKSIVN